MPIVKMKRLQVLALERDHDALLRQLERMGCVEISEPDAPDAPESLRRCDSETADCLARHRRGGIPERDGAGRRAGAGPPGQRGNGTITAADGAGRPAGDRPDHPGALAEPGPVPGADGDTLLRRDPGRTAALRPLGRTVWAGTKRISGERAVSALRRPAAAVRTAHHPQGSDGTGAGAAAGPGLRGLTPEGPHRHAGGKPAAGRGPAGRGQAAAGGPAKAAG